MGSSSGNGNRSGAASRRRQNYDIYDWSSIADLPF